MSEEVEVYSGVASVYRELIGSNTGLLPVGEVSSLTIAYNVNTENLRDNQSLSGGLVSTYSRVESMEVAMTMHNFSTENLKTAEVGSSTSVTGAAIVDEPCVLIAGSFINTLYSGISLVSVNDALLSAGTAFTEGTDYEVRSGGIFILDTFTGVDGTVGYISYTHQNIDVIQALTSASKSYRYFIDGLNAVRSGDPYSHELFIVKSTPAASLQLINGGAYGGMDITGQVLSDPTKTGTDISKFKRSIKRTAY